MYYIQSRSAAWSLGDTKIIQKFIQIDQFLLGFNLFFIVEVMN